MGNHQDHLTNLSVYFILQSGNSNNPRIFFSCTTQSSTEGNTVVIKHTPPYFPATEKEEKYKTTQKWFEDIKVTVLELTEWKLRPQHAHVSFILIHI